MTIAMIYREVGTCGGIQRGASFQVDQFRGWGYDPVVLTEKDLGHDAGRMDRLAAILRERQIDLVIEHDAYSEEKLSADISASRSAEVPIVVFWHSVFSWMFANGTANAADVMGVLSKADALITLSPTDEAFFRLLGCRALSIPYCDADLMGGFERKGHPHRILWMGRLVGLKRPMDAIRIAERVKAEIPDAELAMLGDGSHDVLRKIESYLEQRPALRGAVELAGFQKDVRPYLEASGVGLVTSKFEGYSHAIVEMKMASMPVVSYAMPYLVTLKDGTGAVQVPQGGVDAAAAEIVKLFLDGDLCARLGRAARRSYEEIAAFDQRKAYERLFADLGKPREESSLLAINPDAATRAMRVLAEHAQMGLATTKERMQRQIMAKESRKGLIGLIGRALIRVGRRLARP